MRRASELLRRFFSAGGALLLVLANLLCAVALVFAWLDGHLCVVVFCGTFNLISLGGWILCGRLGTLCGSLYFPGGHDCRPQPVYGPALALKAQGEYEQALQALLAIAKEFPDTARPLLEALDILAEHMHDSAQFHAVYHWGKQRLRDSVEREALEQGYHARSRDLSGTE